MRYALVLLVLCLCGCNPRLLELLRLRRTVRVFLSDHSAELRTRLGELSAVQAALGSAPVSDVPFTGLPARDFATIPWEDFGELDTSPEEAPTHTPDRVLGRPSLEHNIAYLAAVLRHAPVPTYEAGEVARLEAALEELRGVRRVAVVQTLQRAEATDRAERRWTGRVLLWDLAARRWVGALSVSVRDGMSYSRGYVWVSARGIRSADTTPEQALRNFSGMLNRATSSAVLSGVSQAYSAANSQLTPEAPRPEEPPAAVLLSAPREPRLRAQRR